MRFSIQSVFISTLPALLLASQDVIVTETILRTVTTCPEGQQTFSHNHFGIPGSVSHAYPSSLSGSGVPGFFTQVSSCATGVPSSVFYSSPASSSQSAFPRASYSEVGVSSEAASITRAAPSSNCSSQISASATPTACSYWLEDINHQGLAAFNFNPSVYQVFRNVKDFGAKGDGVTDDTTAINLAISSGNRCAPGKCGSSSTTPALIYFPAGTYIVSSPIIDYYHTQIIGNLNCLPIIKATSGFTDRWVIDGDQYQSSGNLGYGATNVFWRQIRNFVIDMTAISPSILVSGIHWSTAQATSLQNILFKMTTASGVQHEGVFIESGSGGLVTDLTFYGGLHGMTVGNQQFTMRNLTFHNAVTAISQVWDWGWIYKSISINNCGTGLDMSNVNNVASDLNKGGQTVGSVLFLDSHITNTPVGILMARSATSTQPSGGSLILENVRLNNVETAVKGPNGPVLEGSTGPSLITAWGQGHSYDLSGPATFQGPFTNTPKPDILTAGTDYYESSKPQYQDYPVGEIISVRDAGAKGDGVTDDTGTLNSILSSAAKAQKIVYFDAGTYLVKSTVHIPPGSRIAGEAYPVIMSSGDFFADMNSPQLVIQVRVQGQSGSIEWSDMIISTQGAQAGATLNQWSLAAPTASPSGMWDVHTRIGGFAGSSLQLANCPKIPDTIITTANVPRQCIAAFMSMHITSSASGLYMENNWFWVADHDVEDPSLSQITIYAGRGLLIESSLGGIWLVGTAVEHHQLYGYQLANTQSIFMGQIQTETAYYQPNPDATIPFPAVSAIHDPVLSYGDSGWGLRIVNSEEILVYGAGLYSFFSNYDVHCSNQGNGETCQRRVLSVEGSERVQVFNLNTVGVTKMITVDGEDVADFNDNLNGFVDTVALFQPSV